MRMGYEFHEKFLEWLKEQDQTVNVGPWKVSMKAYIKNRYKEFEELWFSGQVEVPPLKETLPTAREVRDKIIEDHHEVLKKLNTGSKKIRLPPKR